MDVPFHGITSSTPLSPHLSPPEIHFFDIRSPTPSGLSLVITSVIYRLADVLAGAGRPINRSSHDDTSHLATLRNRDILIRLLAFASDILDLLDNIHAIHDLPKHNVLVVQPGSRHSGDEKLRPILIRSCVLRSTSACVLRPTIFRADSQPSTTSPQYRAVT